MYWSELSRRYGTPKHAKFIVLFVSDPTPFFKGKVILPEPVLGFRRRGAKKKSGHLSK